MSFGWDRMERMVRTENLHQVALESTAADVSADATLTLVTLLVEE